MFYSDQPRTELATVTGEFAQTVSDLASSDVGTQLSQSLSGLADVERKSQELQTIQSDQDMITILATSDEYSRLINSVRVSLFERERNTPEVLIHLLSWHLRREFGRITSARLLRASW